jgi:hypothetical protein
MPTEIHDPLNVSSEEEILQRMDAFIDFLKLKMDSSDEDCERYCYRHIIQYIEEHARCIRIDRWHAQTVREKVDD